MKFDRNLEGGLIKEELYRKLLHMGEQRKKTNTRTRKNKKKKEKDKKT